MTLRHLGAGGKGGLDPDRIDQLRAGNERHAQAGEGEQDAPISGILVHVMKAAFDCSNRDRISDEQRLGPGLDRKQAGDTVAHSHG